MNEIIADEKDINNENIFKYQNPSFLVKDLISAKQNKNEELVNNINNGLIDLRNDINRKEIPENKNPNKVADIVEKIIDFNKEQEGKVLPRTLASLRSDLARVAKVFDRTQLIILIPKQMFQCLPTAFAQVKQVKHLKT